MWRGACCIANLRLGFSDASQDFVVGLHKMGLETVKPIFRHAVVSVIILGRHAETFIRLRGVFQGRHADTGIRLTYGGDCGIMQNLNDAVVVILARVCASRRCLLAARTHKFPPPGYRASAARKEQRPDVDMGRLQASISKEA